MDSLTGRNSGDNRGPGTQQVSLEPWLGDDLEVRLLLKGGGCENQSAQYSLPCVLPGLGPAERTLEGVRRCLLHAVHQAQGYGCSVGILGAAIGSDRAGGYQAAAEPTTSQREEPYEAELIRRFGVRAVIGKGGMGPRTQAALRECGAVYLSAVGGAAQLYASCIEAVEGVDLLELGPPEAMWHVRVKDSPVVVTPPGGAAHQDLA